jgi:hypothetical protein
MPVMNATGYWDSGDFGSTPQYNSGLPEERNITESISKKDRNTLRRLARRVSELAARSREKQCRELWFKHNSLKPTRPLIICDPENGWNEIIKGNSLECSSRLTRHWEMALKKDIFWGEEILDDRPIEPYFSLGYTFTDDGWGVEEKFRGGRDGGSYTWEPGIKEYKDIEKLHFPKIEVDYDTTKNIFDLASDIFDDILTVKTVGVWWWSFGMTYDLAVLRGLEQMMLDMIREPQLIHDLMKFLTEGNLKKLDFLESNDLLSLNNELYLGPGGFGYTDELPGSGFRGNVRTNDMWGFSESQETVGISPEMFSEFIFPYQVSILKRFGLNCYGCCEPLDTRWDIIKNIPRLRRVTVSPFADIEKMADQLEDKYCYCLKPHPADLARPEMDEESVRKKLRHAFDVARNCRVEVLMQDNHTIGRNPQNVVNWVRIAKEESERAVS